MSAPDPLGCFTIGWKRKAHAPALFSVRVVQVYTYSEQLDLGLLLKVDQSEVEAPMYTNLYILMFTAVGIVTLGVLVLALAAQKMLKSMMDTWEKGKQAVQQQKVPFYGGALVLGFLAVPADG